MSQEPAIPKYPITQDQIQVARATQQLVRIYPNGKLINYGQGRARVRAAGKYRTRGQGGIWRRSQKLVTAQRRSGVGYIEPTRRNMAIVPKKARR